MKQAVHMHFLSNLWNLPAKELFALTVLGAVVSTIGNLLATILKEYFFVRSLENWRTQRGLRAAFKKYRDPLVLSLIELLNRLDEILYSAPVHFLDQKLLALNPLQMNENNANDLYYQKYKLVSTIYRLCACLGWLELYRRDVTFLDSGHHRTNSKFEGLVHKLRSCMADGHLNDAQDWEEWEDSLIFREEQRAIGETMIDAKGNVLGYSAFCEKFQPKSPIIPDPWMRVATSFLLDLQGTKPAGKDFRRARCMLLVRHGISLIECLDSRRVDERLRRLSEAVNKDLPTFPISEIELHTKKAMTAVAR
jgi:hypothetical protein